MTEASAPGKIILFGEHAVVYGRPALAVPVTQVQATAEVTALPEPPSGGKQSPYHIHVEAPDISLSADLGELVSAASPSPLAAAIMGALRFLRVEAPPPMLIRIHSTIPVAAGMGSGAAVSVAVLRALSALLGQPLTNEETSALAFEVEKLHHGTPSGIDNTVIAFAAPVYFMRGRPVETFKAAKPFTLVIGDTGIPAPTKESVADVRKLWQAKPALMENIFDRIGEVVRKARADIESGDLSSLGSLMDENHALLQNLGVSSAELEQLVSATRAAGAMGAKLSGGGRGGNMIALAQKESAPAVTEALRSAGAKRVIITEVS